MENQNTQKPEVIFDYSLDDEIKRVSLYIKKHELYKDKGKIGGFNRQKIYTRIFTTSKRPGKCGANFPNF